MGVAHDCRAVCGIRLVLFRQKEFGYCHPGDLMSVNPGFGGQKFIPHTVEKIRQLRELITAKDSKALIEVDGGVTLENASMLMQAGADVLVAGSSVFNAPDPEEACARFASL